jgi:hypothetical protein
LYFLFLEPGGLRLHLFTTEIGTSPTSSHFSSSSASSSFSSISSSSNIKGLFLPLLVSVTFKATIF